MAGRVLHILSQRPGLTGSGVTLEAMVRQAARAGWRQKVVIGTPAPEPAPRIGDLPANAVLPVRFGTPTADLPFPVPGMSDVMPYQSSVWSDLTADQLDRYRTVWREHLARIVAELAPDVIHSHHIWLVTALLKDVAPGVPVVATCHSTGLRQMKLVPRLAAEVQTGCARLDHFCVLRDDHKTSLQQSLQVPATRITVVGAGYRPEVFHPAAHGAGRPTDILYVGKYSHAKGLPWLCEAFSQLQAAHPELRLHVAGDGSGTEAEELRRRLTGMAPTVRLHGQLNQPELAALMRQCGVCVLPSFYEGVPLVLVEAAACGCRLVATALPGVVSHLAPQLGSRLTMVPRPRMVSVDRPHPADLPRFVANLAQALDQAVAGARSAASPDQTDLAPFSWQAVFSRVEEIWRGLIPVGSD